MIPRSSSSSKEVFFFLLAPQFYFQYEARSSSPFQTTIRASYKFVETIPIQTNNTLSESQTSLYRFHVVLVVFQSIYLSNLSPAALYS